jgi:four helix bundle protein
MQVQSFRDLEAWQLGMEFVTRIYALTRQFPREETYLLTAQLRRAAVGIPSSISEGHQRGTKAYLHYVTVALGSLAEAETHLELAMRLEMAPLDSIAPVLERATRLRQVLHGLRRALIRRGW